jgi:hypothetical protein
MSRMIVLVSLFIYACAGQGDCVTVDCYNDERALLVREDLASLLGENETDTKAEAQVEALLFSLRGELKQKFFDPPLGQRNWRDVELFARSTHLYKILKAMPKGAALHVHGIQNVAVAVSIGTYLPSCFVDLQNTSQTHGYFHYGNPPNERWTNTVNARANATDPKLFDQLLIDNLLFKTPDLNVNETEMWVYFDAQLGKVNSLMSGRKEIISFLIF